MQKEKTLKEATIAAKKARNPKDITICDSTAQMLEKARRDGVEIAFDRTANMRACPIGEKSACCKHCAMGPCRLNAKYPYKQVGVCGANIDTIMSRNFARMVATGSACHNDHGMTMLDVFRDVVNGTIDDYEIKDTAKLEQVAGSIGIEVDGRSPKDIATDLYQELEKTYTQVDGEIPFAMRVPEKTLETWRKLDIVPRGAMREVMELMSRTHMGCDQHYENITKQCSRTALADGWGGSMVATEIGDILFGTP
ncbi:MAG: carbon monoxide dehydrogenase, partial [Desulfobacterales bacterium]